MSMIPTYFTSIIFNKIYPSSLGLGHYNYCIELFSKISCTNATIVDLDLE